MANMQTDWDDVAAWYDGYLEDDVDTYQEKVITPNLLRMLNLHSDSRVLDIACGQGYFARRSAEKGAIVTGIDQSGELIALASARAGEREQYTIADAQKIETLNLGEFDCAYTVLAFENIPDIKAVLQGVATVLTDDGKFIVVLLHPAFRIPKYSDWGYDSAKGTQYRKTEKYLSEIIIPIELSPFRQSARTVTHTFHRSLQWYMKAFKSAGFCITGMEEWISHKRSGPGPRQAAEDSARKEFPMFLALELKKR